MARPGRLFLPLDVSYFDDSRVVELSDGAQLLDIRAMVLVRRLQSDGRVTRTQMHRIAPSGGDIGAMITELVKVGLWAEDGDELVRRAWADWNDTAADIAAMAKGGSLGNHLRWHTKRGVVSADCPHCASGQDREGIGGESPPDSGPESIEQSRAEETRGGRPDDIALAAALQCAGWKVERQGRSVSKILMAKIARDDYLVECQGTAKANPRWDAEAVARDVNRRVG